MRHTNKIYVFPLFYCKWLEMETDTRLVYPINKMKKEIKNVHSSTQNNASGIESEKRIVNLHSKHGKMKHVLITA